MCRTNLSFGGLKYVAKGPAVFQGELTFRSFSSLVASAISYNKQMWMKGGAVLRRAIAPVDPPVVATWYFVYALFAGFQKFSTTLPPELELSQSHEKSSFWVVDHALQNSTSSSKPLWG